MPCGATQDGQIMVERSDKMWSTGEGNGKPLQYSCLENPMNSVNSILTLKVKVKSLSCNQLFVTPWTVAHQAPPSMGFSRQKYWSGLPLPSPVDHILSDLSTMTLLSWVTPQAWLNFIELDEAVVLVIRLTSFL